MAAPSECGALPGNGKCGAVPIRFAGGRPALEVRFLLGWFFESFETALVLSKYFLVWCALHAKIFPGQPRPTVHVRGDHLTQRLARGSADVDEYCCYLDVCVAMIYWGCGADSGGRERWRPRALANRLRSAGFCADFLNGALRRCRPQDFELEIRLMPMAGGFPVRCHAEDSSLDFREFLLAFASHSEICNLKLWWETMRFSPSPMCICPLDRPTFGHFVCGVLVSASDSTAPELYHAVRSLLHEFVQIVEPHLVDIASGAERPRLPNRRLSGEIKADIVSKREARAAVDRQAVQRHYRVRSWFQSACL